MQENHSTDRIPALQQKMRAFLRQVPQLRRAFALVWRAAPSWTLLWLVLLVIQGLLPVLTVYLTRALVDSLVAVSETSVDWQTAQPTLVLAVSMGVILLVGEMLRSVSGWIRTAQSERVKDHVAALTQEKAQEMDLAFFDLPENFDHLYRARTQAIHRPTVLLENMGSLLQNGITLVAMASVLLQFGLWIPIALIVATVPALFVVLQHAVRRHRWYLSATEKERRAWYYDWVLTARESAAEMRIFALAPYFRAQYVAMRDALRTGNTELARAQGLAEFGASAIALVVTAVTLLWMVWQAMQGIVSLGDLAMFYQAFNQGQRLLRSLLANVGEIYSNGLFIEDLFEYLHMQPTIVDPPNPVALPVCGEEYAAQMPTGTMERPLDGIAKQGATSETIRGVDVALRDVVFCYPGSERIALAGIDLHIPTGQMAAIVGANGAGKSTLIKLLCRMYDPDDGVVEMNGVDLRCLRLEEIRRQITVLFQVPMQYNATVAENIMLGDLQRSPDQDMIAVAAHQTGTDRVIERLPHAYDTLLGRWFVGGTDLSVGEWQRIALARAFVRQASLLILDEPTSAMDPWAETDWIARFRHMAVGRTALLITHRFTTAMHADVIHVMDAGRIVESGTHDELYAQGGRYATAWAEQMRGSAIDGDTYLDRNKAA